ncbi:cytochrome-c peroxidase [Flavobacteriales bacterium]|nr:cytochrome-c peroxidase [Flavobacteriales bacterium]
MSKKIAIAVILSTFLYLSCKKEEIKGGYFNTTPYVLEFGNLPTPVIPIDNPLTEEGVYLGRLLFYDKMLSSDESISCGSCHVQESGFSDTSRFSIGVLGLPGGRQAMSAVNMLWNSNQFFWDGRANLLRDQSLLPIQDSLEMHETLPSIIAKLESKVMYKSLFKRAFGSDEINSQKVSLALEQFMNSIVSSNSRFDKAERGEAVYTASERRGKILFYTEYNAFFPSASGADCVHCHSGNNFENDLYMNNGLDSDADMMDDGRMKATGTPTDKAKFKVPTLRNIALTPPYMHDGRFNTLEEVVDHYNSGLVSSSTIDPSMDSPVLTGLFLDAQAKTDLVNFLKTLTDKEMVNNPAYSNPFE